MEHRKTSLSPLQLMQKFYNDYNRNKQFSSPFDDGNCKYSRNKSSTTDKLTKFLNNYDKRQRGISTIVSSYGNSLKDNASSEHHTRYRTNTSEAANRCYFKNSYSESHPFLTTSHKLVQKQLENGKIIKTEPIQTITGKQMYSNIKLMTPTENRATVQDLKQKMIRIKVFKKEKMEKIRYNYLLTNCFKAYKEQELPARESRIRMSQVSTKQRIFPQNVVNNLKL